MRRSVRRRLDTTPEAVKHIVRLLRWAIRALDRTTAGSRPTGRQLKDAIVHVAYEVAAMERSALDCYSMGGPWPFEAFLLHARQVREFLWSKWSPTDRYCESAVYAEMYFADPVTWRNRKGSLPPVVHETKTAIDKQLAHITVDRGDPTAFKDLEREVKPISEALLKRFEHFLNELPEHQRPLFRGALTAKRSELGLD